MRWRDSKRKQRAENFRTKEQAQQLLRKLQRGETEVAESGLSFALFADRWMRDYCRVEKAESQWVSDWNLIKGYLLPTFGSSRLSELSKLSLLEFRGQLKTEGRLSVKTINLATALGKKMLATAVDWELLRKNPWQEVKLLKQPEQPFAYWTPEERDRFLSFCRREDDVFADLVEFACHTGLRMGELRGLQRDCLDFDRGKITVRRGWARDLAGSGQLLAYTKGKRIRDVEMNSTVRRIVADQRLKLPGAFVFEFKPQHVSRKLKRIAKAAEVKQIRFHDLRHTFASHLACAGVPIHKIQGLLGHTDLKQTLRYAHLSPESFEGLTAVLVSARNGHAQDGKKVSNGN